MNLRDKLNWSARQEDLEILLEEPFEIDIEDFQKIYVIGYNHRMKKFRTAKRLKLSEKERENINYAIGYDYTSETRIGLAYCYHYLNAKGISQELLEDVKRLWRGLSCSIQGSGCVIGLIKKAKTRLIWPEFVELPEIEKLYWEVGKRIQQTPENQRMLDIVRERAIHLENIKDKFEAGLETRMARYRDFSKNYRPKHIDRETWNQISIVECHAFGAGISSMVYLFKPPHV